MSTFDCIACCGAGEDHTGITCPACRGVGVPSAPLPVRDDLPRRAASDESLVPVPDYYAVPGLRLEGGEPVTFVSLVHALNLNHQMGNVLKYVIRAGRKPGTPAAKDIRKAARCCLSELKRLGETLDGAG